MARWRLVAHIKRSLGGEVGQSVVEYALGLSLSLLLIMGVVDFGRAFFLFNLVASTAREGARYATIGSRTSAAIVTYAQQQAGIGGLTVSVVSRGTAGNPASPAVIEVSTTFSPITPLIGAICCSGGPLPLAARSSMFVEQ